MGSIPVLNGFVHVETPALPFSRWHPEIQQEASRMHSVIVAGCFSSPDVELIRIPGRNTGCVQQCRKLHSQTKKGDVVLLHISDVLHATFEFQGQFPCLCIAHDKGHYQAQSEGRFLIKKTGNPAGKIAGLHA